MTADALLGALAIFGLRVFNNAISTIRVVLITRDKRFWSAVLGFIEALTFAVVIANVVKDLSNVLNMLAYCGGYAIGGYVGMALDARFVTSYVVAIIITKTHGHEIALALRKIGFGVTEAQGEGRDGQVTVLRSVTARRDLRQLSEVVYQIQPDAFVSVVEAKHIQHGWLPSDHMGGPA
jgi:uncharacterized protein YebE (UPF0316 family)